MKHAKLPTIIDGAEVFDSEGTLALQVNGFDIMHLNVLWWPEDDRHNGERPFLTIEQHQQIIDVICEALGVKT